MSRLMMGTDEVLRVMMGTEEVTSLFMGSEEISSGGTPEPEPIDYLRIPVTIEVVSAGSINFKGTDGRHLIYSINGGTPVRKDFTENDLEINLTGLTAGDTIALTVSGTQVCFGYLNTGCTSYNVYGNLMSLEYEDFTSATALTGSSCFQYLFAETPVVDASNLILPDVATTSACCLGMFRSCSALTYGPQLLPKTLATSSYQELFYDCRNLVYAKCLAENPIAGGNQAFTVKQIFGRNGMPEGILTTGTFEIKRGVTWPISASGYRVNYSFPVNWTYVEVDS